MGSLKLLAPNAGRTRLCESEIESLVARAAEGDEHAWSGLVRQFDGLVWSVPRNYRLGDEDAADVAQTTWLRLVEHVGRLRDPARVGVWLLTTARRESLLRRRPQPVCLMAGDELPERPDESTPEPDSGLLRSERDDALWAAVERLGRRDQLLLGMLMSDPAPSYDEIASTLGMPIGSIGPTRARALERLRREIADDEPIVRAA